ncbi:hypothetical protein Back11_59890 [Paenibacillus baekrokdamisoli]|uniref:AAA domain-containing protein n=1 Tax=Paenibacillus baekrokdamisoli TaxID=1712516 RepID=A0A3G9JP57_9BACL|nr:hypothetical protein [Paenibacillus baekrokdamisoli]BBH24644.1 hypothetical protein Back11_59890 [Paenibacillus baekrokdamisoli]
MKAPLIAFIGTTPNIGTTVAAIAAACRMAQEGALSVGYLCLNLKSSKLHRYVGVDSPSITLDSLRPELRTNSLYSDKLLRSMHQARGNNNCHLLFGNIMRDQAEFFTVEEMDHLLDVAQQSFDVVIADVSAYWDNAATLCTLRRANSRILVTTSALSHFQEDAQRWIKQLSPVFGIASDDYEAVIVHPPWRNGGFHVKEICKELGVPFIGEWRLSEDLLSQLDSGMLDEWLVQNEQGKRLMAEPAKQIIRKHGLHRQVQIAIQPWYKKLLTHRGEVGS